MNSIKFLNDKEVKNLKMQALSNNVEGKNIVIFGDSIAKGDHSEGGVWKRLEMEYDVTIHNYARNSAVMCDGVHNFDLSSQVQGMIDDEIVPDIVVFMFTFNEISNASRVMNTANSIGFPHNNNRSTSIGNLEYWFNYFLSNYKEAKMCFVRYPIKVAQNERSFFLAQFDYSLYLLCEIYGVPICNMKNSGAVFDENAKHFTIDGIHFNSLGVDKLLYPFIKGFLLSGMSVKNVEPENCIGLFGTQATMENYISMLNTIANVYGKKNFAKTFNGVWFYTTQDTTDTDVHFGYLINTYNQMHGSFGEYWKSNDLSIIRFNLYKKVYRESKSLCPLSIISGIKTHNLKTGICTVSTDGSALKFSISLFFDSTTNLPMPEIIDARTCLRLFTFNQSEIFAHIPKGILCKVGILLIGVFSNHQLNPYEIGLLVNEDNTASLYIVGGGGTYEHMQCGGGDITTLSSLIPY